MCGYVKGMFPSLPVGVVHDHEVFQPRQSYHVCEFLLDQYAARKGTVAEFRDAGLAMGRRGRHVDIFSLNMIDGGTQASGTAAWDCPFRRDRGPGHLRAQLPDDRPADPRLGIVLGSAGCALTMWRYDRNS